MTGIILHIKSTLGNVRNLSDSGEKKMGKTGFLLVGAAVGAAVGVVFNYVFGPTDGARYDESYRSRWDKALEDGDRAADEREAEMRRRFEAAKRPRPAAPNSPATPNNDVGQLPGNT